jgi:SAM-dependent methyltransferase
MSGSGRYIMRGGLEGRERLRVLARAMHPTTAALFDRVGVVAGMRCLDVGCGGGDVTRELARQAAPGGSALGIDIDGAKIELAAAEAAADGGAIEFRQCDILETDFEPEFDLIYVRFVLTHLVDPAATVARMARWLRPATGRLVVEDIDFTGSFFHPASSAYDRYADLYTRTAHARGVDPNIGPRLPGLLADAGCRDVHLNVVQPAGRSPTGHERDVKLVSPLTLEIIADSVIAEAIARREEIEPVVDELYRLAADETTVLAIPRIVQAWGRARDL